jgi:hypothetical protein
MRVFPSNSVRFNPFPVLAEKITHSIFSPAPGRPTDGRIAWSQREAQANDPGGIPASPDGPGQRRTRVVVVPLHKMRAASHAGERPVPASFAMGPKAEQAEQGIVGLRRVARIPRESVSLHEEVQVVGRDPADRTDERLVALLEGIARVEGRGVDRAGCILPEPPLVLELKLEESFERRHGPASRWIG